MPCYPFLLPVKPIMAIMNSLLMHIIAITRDKMVGYWSVPEEDYRDDLGPNSGWRASNNKNDCHD